MAFTKKELQQALENAKNAGDSDAVRKLQSVFDKHFGAVTDAPRPAAETTVSQSEEQAGAGSSPQVSGPGPRIGLPELAKRTELEPLGREAAITAMQIPAAAVAGTVGALASGPAAPVVGPAAALAAEGAVGYYGRKWLGASPEEAKKETIYDFAFGLPVAGVAKGADLALSATKLANRGDDLFRSAEKTLREAGIDTPPGMRQGSGYFARGDTAYYPQKLERAAADKNVFEEAERQRLTSEPSLEQAAGDVREDLRDAKKAASEGYESEFQGILKESIDTENKRIDAGLDIMETTKRLRDKYGVVTDVKKAKDAGLKIDAKDPRGGVNEAAKLIDDIEKSVEFYTSFNRGADWESSGGQYMKNFMRPEGGWSRGNFVAALDSWRNEVGEAIQKAQTEVAKYGTGARKVALLGELYHDGILKAQARFLPDEKAVKAWEKQRKDWKEYYEMFSSLSSEISESGRNKTRIMNMLRDDQKWEDMQELMTRIGGDPEEAKQAIGKALVRDNALYSGNKIRTRESFEGQLQRLKDDIGDDRFDEIFLATDDVKDMLDRTRTALDALEVLRRYSNKGVIPGVQDSAISRALNTFLGGKVGNVIYRSMVNLLPRTAGAERKAINNFLNSARMVAGDVIDRVVPLSEDQEYAAPAGIGPLEGAAPNEPQKTPRQLQDYLNQ